MSGKKNTNKIPEAGYTREREKKRDEILREGAKRLGGLRSHRYSYPIQQDLGMIPAVQPDGSVKWTDPLVQGRPKVVDWNKLTSVKQD